jgi:hypothetical protein
MEGVVVGLITIQCGLTVAGVNAGFVSKALKGVLRCRAPSARRAPS